MKKRSIKNLELNKRTISVLTDKEKLTVHGGITPVTASSLFCVRATIGITIALSEKYCPDADADGDTNS